MCPGSRRPFPFDHAAAEPAPAGRRIARRPVHLADTRRRLGERLACEKVAANVRLHQLLQASDAKLHQLGERWAALKLDYAAKAAAMKIEYAERAVLQYDEARAALAELRREVQRALRLLELARAAA